MKKLATLVGGSALVLGNSAMAALPTTGVDLATDITSGVTALGAIVAVAVGGYIAFRIIRKALSWVNTALRG